MNGIIVCDGKISENRVIISKNKHEGIISAEDFKAVVEELKDSLIYVEGVEESSYDNSDDDRAGCYSSRWPFGYYCEIDPENNSEHLLRIDGKIVGIVFFVRQGYGRDVDFYPFLFDDSIQNQMRTGYGASHSSDYIYVNKVTLVKRGENGAPESGRRIYFSKGKSDTSL
ncbi:MAG: hypothetical protein IJ515_02880 [Clostridia bacterium]|nr:hypothetical protein [Clostridia bacterium]